MGGTTVLERLATLETEMAYVRSTVDGLDSKLDKLSDLVDIRITQADTRRDLLAAFGKYGSWVLAGALGLAGGKVGGYVTDWLHHFPGVAG